LAFQSDDFELPDAGYFELPDAGYFELPDAGYFESTWCRLFQKGVVCTKCDMCVLIYKHTFFKKKSKII